jgi:hypothetical protein
VVEWRESVLEVADVYIYPPELGRTRETRDALARASAISERAVVIADGLSSCGGHCGCALASRWSGHSEPTMQAVTSR